MYDRDGKKRLEELKEEIEEYINEFFEGDIKRLGIKNIEIEINLNDETEE